ncbi:MAG TPA: retropepsin-like aspartic protease [Candidatus Angelobacter sp.]|nr:retropepsin-like aspartic protease [Candidatus Angelobacter sp.]
MYSLACFRYRSNSVNKTGTFTLLLLIGLCMPARGFAQAATPASARRLETLIQERKYLELERRLDEHHAPQDAGFFRGIMANRKNRVAESIKLLEPLVSKFAAQPPSWREQELLRTLADDYAKSFEYAKSADTFAALLKRYDKTLPPEQRRAAGERQGAMQILRASPKQTVELNGPAMLASTRNKLGLIEIPVEIDGKREMWVLDTGANTSVVTESTARRIGLELLPGTAQTGGYTGAPVRFHVGVLPKLKIGNTIFHNVELDVAEDKEFNFGGYQISGLVGYPLQSALGRITFYADGSVGLNTEPASKSGSEMFMEEQMPAGAARAAGAERLFTLDTGAGSTFSFRFYNVVKPQLTKAMRAHSELSGAGGTHKMRSYLLPELKMNIGGEDVTLKSVTVLPEPLGGDSVGDLFFGNLGQDVFGAFKSFTFDFQRMMVEARK